MIFWWLMILVVSVGILVSTFKIRRLAPERKPMSVQTFDSLDDLLAYLHHAENSAQERAKTHHLKVEDLRHGDYFSRVSHGVTIFGEVIENTDDPEEDAEIKRGRQRGYVFARCFSVFSPFGELGDTHITNISEKIDRTTFDRAEANGWR